ncbi:N-6 DNA methylase [Halobacteriovorax sp. HLS]|uniref:N-6 DNA methylase n=1 Tax=Halobacteriovorax sp. HLS TaxID=2234000 RepID=UPI000FDA845F|nr:N-6 DNA methylase [Halobacteriovorax sp. HLS]
MDLTGVINSNEFYQNHYLNSIIETDLKEVYKKWTKKEEENVEYQSPVKLIGSIGKKYFSKIEEFNNLKSYEQKIKIQREFFEELINILGYSFKVDHVEIGDQKHAPLLSQATDSKGAPLLWIIESLTDLNEDPLVVNVQSDLFKPSDVECLDTTYENLINITFYSVPEPPRWIILMSLGGVTLFNREKWTERRYLKFDFQDIFDRKNVEIYKMIGALLSSDNLIPNDGQSLLDVLDEKSHKHAFSVSNDLKYSLREAVELLGNEVIFYLREVRREKVYGVELAQNLTSECLRYLYRLLFCFYVESRPQLGISQMKSDAYRKGYSLDSLRDLEMIPLVSQDSVNGYYLHESLNTLFNIYYQGIGNRSLEGDYEKLSLHLEFTEKKMFNTFEIPSLKSHLFNDSKIPLISKVKLRNGVLQKVIQLLSLSRPGSTKKKRGRISYSDLGINQLGAVYEGLLSYNGFFAEEDLYEVKIAGSDYNILDEAFFVNKDQLEKYSEDERVFEANKLKKFDKGTFIYRLSGSARQNSASYYTPEVLTNTLVKYTLRDYLKNKTSEEILSTTVCEPAMGSGAFLNEAISQLATGYLKKKQEETAKVISLDIYEEELQKVKSYISSNNIYGVDLNPVAVELAEVSLWLNSIYKDSSVPWFGSRLRCGNSLFGVTLSKYDKSVLIEKSKKKQWYNLKPNQVEKNFELLNEGILHFLVPSSFMINYSDKVIKSLAKEDLALLAKTRKEWLTPFSNEEIEDLELITSKVKELFIDVATNMKAISEENKLRLNVWESGIESLMNSDPMTKEDGVVRKLYTTLSGKLSSYHKLKVICDLWCSFFCWPIKHANRLPSRKEHIDLLKYVVFEDSVKQKHTLISLKETCTPNIIDFSSVKDDFVELIKISQEVASNNKFFHWPLEFADQIILNGGFNLILGNPPWVKADWKESSVLADYDPGIVVKKMSSSELKKIREKFFENNELKKEYFFRFEMKSGLKNFLNSEIYFDLKGQKANLYKCFLPLSWRMLTEDGYSSFVHPDGVYDDPKGGPLRERLYKKLKFHFQFRNELNLFEGTNDHGRLIFSLNVYSESREEDYFVHISNLFHPNTIDESFNHNGDGDAPGIKEGGKWSTRGHSNRIIRVTENELKLFSQMLDGAPSVCGRLPVLHSSSLSQVLLKFNQSNRKLMDISEECFATQMWNEVTSQDDGSIEKITDFQSIDSFVMSGPHFYVGNPLNKTPRRVCTANMHYDVLDLMDLEDNYLPRSNFKMTDSPEVISRIPRLSWANKPVHSEYRHVNREMIGPAAERTLISAIIPPGLTFINTCISLNFRNKEELLDFHSLTLSLPFDFRVKSTGMGHANISLLEQLPLLGSKTFQKQLHLRSLLLNCVNSYYDDLWTSSFCKEFLSDSFTKEHELLCLDFGGLSPKKRTFLKSPFSRRQALVEIDVLAAMSLGMSLSELKEIYRIQFPTLVQNENETWYDFEGKIVFTVNKGLIGVGVSRKEWNDIVSNKLEEYSIEKEIDVTPGEPSLKKITYKAPFVKCDREEDYEIAWNAFSNISGDLL